MSWLNKLKPAGIRTDAAASKRNVPEGLWEKVRQLRRGAVPARAGRKPGGLPQVRPPHADPRAVRLTALFDPASTREIAPRLGPVDLLKFKDSKYGERIKAAQKASGEARRAGGDAAC
jgi:acetyl-CoA carboxylase carboxyl transferase subunit beta